MFKVFKYLYLANLYNRAKNSFNMSLIYIVTLLLISFIVNDFISISSGSELYMIILLKWVSILILWSLIGLNIFKIFNIATNPFSESSKEIEKETDTRKDRVLAKKKLQTTSDIIIQKYIKDQ